MQSLIQQIGVRAGIFLMRRPSQTSFAHASLTADGASGTVADGKTADEQTKLFNTLLEAVCRKLLVKIRELDCVSGDLNNLMKVCAIPAIFVDENLVVRNFTRESRQVYRLSHDDIGRSLLDVTCGLDYCRLGDDFRRAVESGKCVSRYLEKRGCDSCYLLRILPSFCRDSSFGGAALVFRQMAGRNWGTA